MILRFLLPSRIAVLAPAGVEEAPLGWYRQRTAKSDNRCQLRTEALLDTDRPKRVPDWFLVYSYHFRPVCLICHNRQGQTECLPWQQQNVPTKSAMELYHSRFDYSRL